MPSLPLAEDQQSILAIDLGESYGWCFKNGDDEESGHGKHSDLMDWGKQFKALVTLWKPNMVVISQTNSYGFFNATRMALLQAGIAFYIAGLKDIPSVEFNDKSARLNALGSGKLKKKEVQAMFPDIQADELDAIILARGWYELNKEKLYL